MEYINTLTAFFVNRINRFTAVVNVDGNDEICHVKNTGRLKELLKSGARVILEKHDDAKRKTKYSLIAVKTENGFVNIDSQAPNKVFYEWVKQGHFCDGVTLIKPETTYGNSRFDCYIEAGNRKIFVEVKGVTLNRDGVALFPDAPTERGVKHLRELCKCTLDGYEAYIVFVAQMKGIHSFSPNIETHKEFGDALKECEKSRVNILCYDCIVTESTLKIDNKIPIKL